jgi:RNA polymerase sigma-70 factor (TIGR02943 family)
MSDNTQGNVQPALSTGLFDSVFIQDLRLQMQKFAILQLNDQHGAEDVVQEALAGALKNVKSFQGNAALKTWVFAILKNKIADVLRQKKRQQDAGQLLSSQEELEDFSELFDDKGHWNEDEKPKDWGRPEQAFEQDEFWEVFDVCLNQLPANQGKVFMAREYIGLSTDEICEENKLTISNLHVLLHRARVRLRECLEHSWFDRGSAQ